MKPSNGELRSDEWGESCKDAKKKQNIIVTLRWYDEQITKPQSWNFTRINTIKNFITLKNNNYRLEGPFFSEGWKKGWDQMVIDKKTFVIPDDVKNSIYIINNNLTWNYIGKSESGDSTETTLSIDWAGYNFTQTGAPYDEDVLKKGSYRGHMKFYSEGA